MPAKLFKVTIFVVGVLLTAPLMTASLANAQGIRQGGSDTHSGLRQQAPSRNQMGQNNRLSQSSQRLGSSASSEAQASSEARRALRQATTQNQVDQNNKPSSPARRQLGGGSLNAQMGNAQTGGAPMTNKQARDARAGRALLQEANKLKARFRQSQSEAAGTARAHRYGFVVAFMDTKSLMKPSFIKGLKKLNNTDGIKFLVFQSDHSVDNLDRSQAKKLEDVEPVMARDDRGGKIAKQYGVEKFPTVLYERPNHEVTKIHTPHSLNAVFRHIRKVKRNQRARR